MKKATALLFAALAATADAFTPSSTFVARSPALAAKNAAEGASSLGMAMERTYIMVSEADRPMGRWVNNGH